MRKPRDYVQAKRSNPHDPAQMEEHPYDFVSLPGTLAQGDVVTHERYRQERYSGPMTLVYTTETPLHVGSGVLETTADRGYDQGNSPLRGIIRRRGRPILPGSSWKGAVRARYETITRSRLALADFNSKEPDFKVPTILRAGNAKRYDVKITDSEVTGRLCPMKKVSSPRDLIKASPAESLFGCLGYRGRLHPGDGAIGLSKPTRPQKIAPMESPLMHRLAKPEKTTTRGSIIELQEVEGRKFYYNGPIVEARTRQTQGRIKKVSELIDIVPKGSTITLKVHLENLSKPEIGALLIAAGYSGRTKEGEPLRIGILRFGGFKPAGLGKVRLESLTLELRKGAATRQWKRPSPTPLSPDDLVQEALEKKLVEPRALQELHQVTTMRRPSPP